MSSCGLAATVFLACVITFTTAQSTCKDRCGLGYYRGNSCQCDYSCLVYGECCDDYESLCTTKNSCKGRCGEAFKRGRQCNCDAECVKYNQCCPDYKDHCDESETSLGATEPSIEGPLTLSEGNDPDDAFFPTINPTSYPQDDPDSASNQISQTGYDGPDSSPLPEGASGSPPTDLLEGLTTGPSLPDLDGFEILPEPATVTSETSTALPQDQTTAEFTSVGPSTVEPKLSTAESTVNTLESTAASTDAVDDNDSTMPPEPTTVVSSASTQPTSDPTTSFTDSQTEPKLPEDTTLMPETTVPYTEATTSTLEITNAAEATEETTPLKPTTIVPTKIDEETTAVQEIDTTESETVTAPTTAEAVSEMSTAVTTNTALESTTVTQQETSQSPTSSPTSTAAAKPDPEKPFKPVLSPEHKPVLNGLGTNTEYQADDSNDTDLCSGRPVSGVTTLSNGTVVVFRGHFFWVLDQNRVPGPAQGITQVWGVPSPIDTVFTRCNCQGKTYIFKGPQYWRYENDVLDRGYPKVVETGFDGLRGHITAALSVPQYKQRRESVYFFKRGGTVQKYAYQFGTNPSCGRKVHYALYTNRNRIARQVQAQVSLLEPAINYRRSWHGFPNTITAAVSIPNKREPEGYSYYVFSRSKSYNIRMSRDRPVIAVNDPNASQSNEVFKCAKKSRS